MKKYYRIIGAVILAILLSRIDYRELMKCFSNLNINSLLLINLCILPALSLKVCRWKYILRLQGIEYPFFDSLVSYLGGVFAGLVSPGRTGEMIKAVYLRNEKQVTVGRGVASVFLDRLFDFYVLAMLGYWGVFHFFSLSHKLFSLCAFFVMFILFPALIMSNNFLFKRVAEALYNLMFLKLDNRLFTGQIKEFLGAVKISIVGRGIWLPIVFTALSYAFHFLESFLLARLLLIDISFLTIVCFISISNIACLLPVTILGMGTRELSLVSLFSLVGLKAESAIAYSFILFFSFYTIPGLLGFIGWTIKEKARKATN